MYLTTRASHPRNWEALVGVVCEKWNIRSSAIFRQKCPAVDEQSVWFKATKPETCGLSLKVGGEAVLMGVFDGRPSISLLIPRASQGADMAVRPVASASTEHSDYLVSKSV